MFDAAAALSLLLCVATVVLWVKSHRRGGFVYSGQTLTIYAPAPHYFAVTHYYPYSGNNPEGFRPREFSFAGFSHSTEIGSGAQCPYAEWEIISDYVAGFWPVLVATGSLPALRLFLVMYSLICRRAVPGHCLRCSYDLTANVSGVCPECGTKIVPKTA
jgi:hypothetical protein